jgi:hypothetical protein
MLSDVNAEIEKTQKRLGHLTQSAAIVKHKIEVGEPSLNMRQRTLTGLPPSSSTPGTLRSIMLQCTSTA